MHLQLAPTKKGRSLLGIKPEHIHREVCDIYGNGQMSHRSVCRWVAKSKTGYEHLKDAARQGRPATVTTNNNIVKIHQISQKRRKIYYEAIGSDDKLDTALR